MSALEGRRVLITAGAGGIGAATARLMAGRGARVHICDISADALDALAETHPAIGRSLCDVSDEAAVDALFSDAARTLGGLDVLVNNAGIAGPTGPIEGLSLADWTVCLGVGLTGQFLCARRAVPLLRTSRRGAMVNISSTAGRLGYANRTPYAAAKWGVVGLTKSLAIELGPSGIAVNAVLPGIVDGPRIDAVVAARAALAGTEDDDERATMLANVSMGRMVTMEEVAETIAHLASPAGWAISGQAIGVCGDVQKL